MPRANETKFVVEVDETATATRLVVPQHLVAPRFKERPVRAPPGGPGKEPIGFAGPGDGHDALAPAPLNQNNLIVAGAALTLALSLGGVWLVRRRARLVAGLPVLAAVGGVLALSAARADPPKAAPPATSLPVAFDGPVRLEVTPAGDTVRLVPDKESYGKLKKGPKAPGKK